LTPQVIDVQASKSASQGAEEFFIQGFIEQGAKLRNIDPAISLRQGRIDKSIGKIDDFFDDLFGRYEMPPGCQTS